MANSKKPIVVVIGAGFAGLGASTRLSSNSGFDVTVLEGSDRLGGRAHTVRLGDQFVDLGCQFFYQREKPPGVDLPQYAMSKNLHVGLKAAHHANKPKPNSDLDLLSNGDRIPHEEVKHCEDIFEKIIDELTIRGERQDWSYVIDSRWSDQNSTVPLNIGLKEYITQRFFSIIAQDTHLFNTSSLWGPKHILENLLFFEGVSIGCKNIESVDIPSYTDYHDEDGYIPLLNGFQSIAKALVSELPQECIQYNKEVQTIQWSPTDHGTSQTCESPVTMKCTDGTIFTADHVIVTVSLGVLKERCLPSPMSSNLFNPPLPTYKLDSIKKLGMGLVNKVVLEFSKSLVSDSFNEICFYWHEEDSDFLEEYPWAKSIGGIERVRDTTIYTVWLTGDDAVAVETIPEEDVTEGICLLLEEFLQCPVERPIRVMITRWCGNKFFKGSYSYNFIGCNEKDRKMLSKPLSDTTPLQVLFAGEATHDSMYGTANTAYETGLREADRLIEFYNSQ